MLKNTLFLSVLSAGMLAAASSPTYHVTLTQNSVVDGHQLERGDYKITLDNNTATLKKGKQVIQVPAKEETATTKYVNTAVEYTGNTIWKIDFGGKHTSIVFGGGNANDGGSATVRGSGVIN